jgi:hypothetical protein
MEDLWTCDTLDCMTEDDRGDAEKESGAEDEGEPGSYSGEGEGPPRRSGPFCGRAKGNSARSCPATAP